MRSLLFRLLPAAILFLAALPSAFALRPLPTDKGAVMSLNGDWRFKLLGADYGPLRASSEQSGHPVPQVMDGDETTRWCADGEGMPQWLQADLGEMSPLDHMEVMWEFESGAYRVKVEGSKDGKSFATLVDLTGAPQIEQRQVIPLRGKQARYVRLVIVGARGGAWASIFEWKVFLQQGGKALAWMPSKSAPPPAEQFWTPQYDDRAWATIPVPSNWEILGFSYPTYWGPDNTEGLYRKWVDIPASYAGKRVYIQFDGVQNGARVYCNGREVGYHESGYTGWEMDLTPYIRAGQRNLLALRVTKNTPSSDLDTGDYQFLGGIYRDVKLVALPKLHIASVKVETTLGEGHREATVTAKVVVEGEKGERFGVDGVLLPPRPPSLGARSERTGRGEGGTSPPAPSPLHGEGGNGSSVIGADGRSGMTLTTTVASPALWSAEKPNLYDLKLSVKGAKTEEQTSIRIGIREIKIRDGVLLVNDVPVKLTGTCRHEIWPDRGAALTEANWRKDVALWKGANINAIRTSHYNPASRLLELCDEMGIYVLEEVPFCWCNVADVKLQPYFIQRAEETLHRDWNHPSVIAWSLGNENGDGPNNQAVVDYTKANDPTRPRFVSCKEASKYPGASFDDFHYPSLGGIRGIETSARRKEFPAMITEEPHIFYIDQALKYDYSVKDLWGELLNRVWGDIWRADSIAGAFIWEWQDQATADKFDSPRDRDPETGLRGVAKKGVVDAWRNPKPEYWHVKMVYSPVVVWGVSGTASYPWRRYASLGPPSSQEGESYTAVLDLQNRYSFTDLSELSLRVSFGGKAVTVPGPKLAPRSRGKVSVKVPGLGQRPAGTAVRFDFVHPTTGTVYSYAIPPAAEPPERPTGPPTPWRCQQAGSTLAFERGEVTASYDTALGLWHEISIGGVPLITSGPLLNLGGERKTAGEHGAKDFVQSDPVLVSSKTDWQETAGGYVLRTESTYSLSDVPDAKVTARYVWALRTTGDIDLIYDLTWAGPARNSWEVGLVLPCEGLIRARGAALSWSRKALWTVYSADHIGAPSGTAKPGSLSFCSSKWNCERASLVDGAGRGLELRPVLQHVRGGVFAQRDGLFVSCRISPPYDFNTPTLGDYLIRLDGKAPFGGRLKITCLGQ